MIFKYDSFLSDYVINLSCPVLQRNGFFVSSAYLATISIVKKETHSLTKGSFELIYRKRLILEKKRTVERDLMRFYWFIEPKSKYNTKLVFSSWIHMVLIDSKKTNNRQQLEIHFVINFYILINPTNQQQT